MNFLKLLVLLTAAVSAVCAADTALSDDVVASYAEAFEKYQVKFEKHYNSKEEYDIHLRAYATSMERIKEFYKNHPDSQVLFGETSRSDFVRDPETPRGVRMSPMHSAIRATGKNTYPQPKLAKNHTEGNMPAEFNWLNVSGVNCPVKEQGLCGSCWAFAAIGAMEMQSVLAGNKFVSLSSQQAVDCTDDSLGCCGGRSEDIFDKTTEFIAEKDYPYVSSNWQNEYVSSSSSVEPDCKPFSCSVRGKEVAVKVNGTDIFYAMTSAELKKQIWLYGPVAVSILAPESFDDYRDGIFTCKGKTLNPQTDGHSVIAVGYGEDYFMVRNSWGTWWGLQGNFKLSDAGYEDSCHLIGRYSRDMPVIRISVIGPSDPEPQSEPQSEPHSEPHSEPQSEPHSDPHSEPHSDPHSEPHSDPHSEPHSDPHSEPHSEPQPQPVEPTNPSGAFLTSPYSHLLAFLLFFVL